MDVDDSFESALLEAEAILNQDQEKTREPTQLEHQDARSSSSAFEGAQQESEATRGHQAILDEVHNAVDSDSSAHLCSSKDSDRSHNREQPTNPDAHSRIGIGSKSSKHKHGNSKDPRRSFKDSVAAEVKKLLKGYLQAGRISSKVGIETLSR